MMAVITVTLLLASTSLLMVSTFREKGGSLFKDWMAALMFGLTVAMLAVVLVGLDPLAK